MRRDAKGTPKTAHHELTTTPFAVVVLMVSEEVKLGGKHAGVKACGSVACCGSTRCHDAVCADSTQGVIAWHCSDQACYLPP